MLHMSATHQRSREAEKFFLADYYGPVYQVVICTSSVAVDKRLSVFTDFDMVCM